jgi:hypothetical protein
MEGDRKPSALAIALDRHGRYRRPYCVAAIESRRIQAVPARQPAFGGRIPPILLNILGKSVFFNRCSR